MAFVRQTFARVHVKYRNDVRSIQKSPIIVRVYQTNAVNVSVYRKRFAWRSATAGGRGGEGELRDARHREITSRVSHPQRGGWAVERTLSTLRPRNHCPGGYLSCLLVYEIQHCYLAPHRGVLGAMRPVVSGEFPTLKGRVPVRDYVLTYPRFFPPHDRL